MKKDITLIPQILETINSGTLTFPIDIAEQKIMQTAKKLFDADFYPHCLLETWNAAVHNLRRRIEAYGVELFKSVIGDESGRKKYNEKGDTLNERWEGVDEIVLISGAKKLGLITRKGAKTLETINWMRNHASPAHSSDEEVTRKEVISFISLLETNLFSIQLPNPGYSIGSIFEPIKNEVLDEEQIETLIDQINSYKQADLRACYGFLIDQLCKGEEPSLTNAKKLAPIAWHKVTDETKKSTGYKYHGFDMNKASDTSSDKGARIRIMEFLIEVKGIAFIPDSSRAKIYRRLARKLADAKDTAYGFGKEVSVSKTINQFGPHVPSIAFEEFYQEVIIVCCGNYWKRSTAHKHLEDDFVFNLNTENLRKIVNFFKDNERVQSELFNPKPKEHAIRILTRIKDKYTLETNKAEVDEVIKKIEKQ